MIKFECKNKMEDDMSIPVEIERKYVIAKPDTELLAQLNGYTISEIEQTYLASSAALTHRVRKRSYADRVSYTETKKVRIDKMSVFEDEREISESEYIELLKSKSEDSVTLRKTRRTFLYEGQIFEVDMYPEWQRTAILETELASREAVVLFPDFIEVIAEVTGDKKYSNAAMSREFPKELM